MSASRPARYVRFRGRLLRLYEAAEQAGLEVNLVWMRMARGWPPDRALETPPRPRRKVAQPAEAS